MATSRKPQNPYLIRRNGIVVDRHNGIVIGTVRRQSVKFDGLPRSTQWTAIAAKPSPLVALAGYRSDAAFLLWENYRENETFLYALSEAS